jgi:hypothetical protein
MPPQRPTLTLREAEALPLMGATTSWDDYGTQPLGRVPDKVLRTARRWFQIKLNEQGDRRAPRFVEQVAAITVILTDREAKSPQGVLAL